MAMGRVLQALEARRLEELVQTLASEAQTCLLLALRLNGCRRSCSPQIALGELLYGTTRRKPVASIITRDTR